MCHEVKPNQYLNQFLPNVIIALVTERAQMIVNCIQISSICMIKLMAFQNIWPNTSGHNVMLCGINYKSQAVRKRKITLSSGYLN